MPPEPRVSVVIAAFNREASIIEAAQSVLEQSHQDLELIVVDDGSSDGTLAALDTLTDTRLRAIALGENRGVSAARNRGIAAARAPWIAFQDSDDVWRPEKLARQMAQLEADATAYVASYCGMEIEGAGASTYVPSPAVHPREGEILPSLVRQSFISTQTLIVRRDILEATGGFDEDLRALVDWDLMLRVAQYGPVSLVDKPLVIQRFSANSITRNARRRVEARAHIVAKHEALLERFPGALAEHHYALSGGYRLCGDLPAARHHMAEARHREPYRARWWLGAARLRALSLVKA